MASVNGAKMEQKKFFRAALYTRVSTTGQNCELQIHELQDMLIAGAGGSWKPTKTS
jgi:hypothetical protein